MQGERHDEAIRENGSPHNHLGAALQPRRFKSYAIGSTQSSHTRVQIGMDLPMVRFHGGRARSAGRVAIRKLEHHMPGNGRFRAKGFINGTEGILSFASGSWQWEPLDGRTRVRDGRFYASTRDVVKHRGTYNLLWAGKNNITHENGSVVIRDARDMIRFCGGTHRVLVLGQWLTPKDGPKTTRALHRVNEIQAREQGRYFLDVQRLLTTEWGLANQPVKHLNLMNNRDALRDIRNGHVPRQLVASDRIHLNGWGYRVVAGAIVEHMKTLNWL